MTWTSPRTWVAGETVTASILNTHVRDNLLDLAGTTAAWTAWSPTVDQGASTNISKTVTEARSKTSGKTIHGMFRLVLAAAGTAGSPVTVNLPATAFSSVAALLGGGAVYDASTTTWYNAFLRKASTTTAIFVADVAADAGWGATPNLALASGDVLVGAFTYEGA